MRRISYNIKNLCSLEDIALKSDLSTIGFILFVTFLFAFCFNSCSTTAIDYFEYTDKSFSAKAEGQIDGDEVGATVSFYPDASADAPKMTVCFHKPESLSGMTVSLFADGHSSARLGSITTEGIELDEMVSPFAVVCAKRQISSAQKGDDGIISVTVRDGDVDLLYTFESGNSFPSLVEGETGGKTISLHISDFEPK